MIYPKWLRLMVLVGTLSHFIMAGIGIYINSNLGFGYNFIFGVFWLIVYLYIKTPRYLEEKECDHTFFPTRDLNNNIIGQQCSLCGHFNPNEVVFKGTIFEKNGPN